MGARRNGRRRARVTLWLCVAMSAPACGSDVARGQKGETTPVAVASAEPVLEEPPPIPPGDERVAPATKPPEPEPAPEPAPEKPLGGAIPIEDPGGHALDAFHTALQRAERGEGKARIAFYGASHVASDLFTGEIRQRLQARFGEGGPGFLLPAKPWRWYRHHGVRMEQSRGFGVRRVRARRPRDDIYGLMGVALQSVKDFGRGSFRTRKNGPLQGHVSSFELYYLKQPNGGTLSVFIDGEREKNLGARAKRAQTAYAHFDVEPGHHSFEVRTHGNGPVRLFGVAAELEGPGVVLDTLGIPGSRARYHLHWDDAVYREHLARRKPDLVVLAYGTNESGDDDVPIATYEARLRKVLTRIQETVPDASCLLVGPSDRPREVEPPRDGSVDAEREAGQADREAQSAAPRESGDTGRYFEDRPRTAQLVESQRRIAAELGCGFFDLVEFMGGPMSMLRWVAADPPLGTPDHVHFTRRGYERLGEVLHDALLARYPDAPPTSAPAPDQTAHQE
ncbi:MAG: GDSL-type esterase/lipase family protein [Myxococcales bacterium]|jgi:lysophospholipase L1-like esterase